MACSMCWKDLQATEIEGEMSRYSKWVSKTGLSSIMGLIGERMSPVVTAWLPILSVRLTSSPSWCERILNSLSLSEACTLSLHQDGLSKMEDEPTLAGKEAGKRHLWWTRLEPESLWLIQMLCKRARGYEARVSFTHLKSFLLSKKPKAKAFEGFTPLLERSQENPYSGSSFLLFKSPTHVSALQTTMASGGNQIIYVLNHQASHKNKVKKPHAHLMRGKQGGKKVLCMRCRFWAEFLSKTAHFERTSFSTSN